MSLLLYFFFFIFALLYSLVIGRASVVSSAPLAVLSLLPSMLMSIVAWVMKSTMLNNGNERSGASDQIDGKERLSNNNGEGIAQNKESHSKDPKANQDIKVIANAMLMENEGREEKRTEEANLQGDITTITKSTLAVTMELKEREESCGGKEKDLEG